MSKLQELIDHLCPNGVEFKPLGEVCDFVNGFAFKSNLFRSKGERIIRITNITGSNVDVMDSKYFELNDYSTDLSKYRVQKGNILIAMSGATTGKIGCYNSNENSYINQRVGMFKPHDELSERFLFHFLSTITTELYILAGGGAQPNLSSNQLMSDVRIPIPPIEVQDEIVKILDRFADYAAELQAELQARRLQYEYYRNLLLTFNSSAYGCGTDGEQEINVTTWGGHSYEIQWKTMGEIGTVKMCKRIMKNQTSSMGEIPFYKIGTFGKEPDAYISRELFQEYKSKYSFPSKGTILISAAGTIGRCVVYDGEDAYFQDSNIVWLENDEKQVLNSYLYHFYQIVEWDTDGGTIKRLYNDRFLATPIPIPPLELQEKIVAILDRFETLVNDLSKGLPAEIEAVKARYEYYRNKLLTFNPLSA